MGNVNQHFDAEEKMFPADEVEGVCDVYCGHFGGHEHILQCIGQVVEERYQGTIKFDATEQTLECTVKTAQFGKMKFGVRVFESKRWKEAYNALDEDEREDREYTALFVVRFRRISGSCYGFMWFRNNHLLVCADVMSGLTGWQRRKLRMVQEKK